MMRENEKKLNEIEDQNNVNRPVIWVVVCLVLLVGVMVWFGIKDPAIFSDISNLVICLFALVFFLLGSVVAFLCFYLSSRIDNAKSEIDKLLTLADGKVEELADKIIILLKKILEPFVEVSAKTAGIFHVFSEKKTEK